MNTSANKISKTNSVHFKGNALRRRIIKEINSVMDDAGNDQQDFRMDDFGGMF